MKFDDHHFEWVMIKKVYLFLATKKGGNFHPRQWQIFENLNHITTKIHGYRIARRARNFLFGSCYFADVVVLFAVQLVFILQFLQWWYVIGKTDSRLVIIIEWWIQKSPHLIRHQCLLSLIHINVCVLLKKLNINVPMFLHINFHWLISNCLSNLLAFKCYISLCSCVQSVSMAKKERVWLYRLILCR